MDEVAERLEQARRDLLDLGLRNTLLNYRELRSKGVYVVDERPEEVFSVLVDQGRGMTFIPAAEDEPGQLPFNVVGDSGSAEKSQLLDEARDPVRTRHRQRDLQTPYSTERLQSRLLNTYYAARTALEEQGVNLLFLALGMLHWYEEESSEECHKAPLLLVPVRLSRADVRARFLMEYTRDEIDTNLSLQMKLKADYGIDLPAVGEGLTKTEVPHYFNHVRRAVKNLPRWHVDHESIVLGFFSFHKLLMYKDLDEAAWPEELTPSIQPILRALLYDGFREPGPCVNETDNLDEKIDPDSLIQVVDADSSQTAAFLEVKAGRNLVIQGPPGTGKSQTITNLMAQAIAEGKKVLFVSEKMAALEVVKRRLDELGLEAPCLELHSHKTNKKRLTRRRCWTN